MFSSTALNFAMLQFFNFFFLRHLIGDIVRIIWMLEVSKMTKKVCLSAFKIFLVPFAGVFWVRFTNLGAMDAIHIYAIAVLVYDHKLKINII